MVLKKIAKVGLVAGFVGFASTFIGAWQEFNRLEKFNSQEPLATYYELRKEKLELNTELRNISYRRHGIEDAKSLETIIPEYQRISEKYKELEQRQEGISSTEDFRALMQKKENYLGHYMILGISSQLLAILGGSYLIYEKYIKQKEMPREKNSDIHNLT